MSTQIQDALLSAHRPTVVACIDAGRHVEKTWSGEVVTQSDRVVEPLGEILEASDLLSALLGPLQTAAETLGEPLTGTPVPAPPYVVVTSRGPMCRGTLADGHRVVVLLELFGISSRTRAYTFRDPTPDDCLSIEIR